MRGFKDQILAVTLLSWALVLPACVRTYTTPTQPAPTVTPAVPTASPTATNTACGTCIATSTPTLTPTLTATNSPTGTPVNSSTPTFTNSPMPTSTLTATTTSTNSPCSACATSTSTATPSITPTQTATPSPTLTGSVTPTQTLTASATSTGTLLQTSTMTPTIVAAAPPMGLYVAAAFDGSVINMIVSGFSYSVTLTGDEVVICYNDSAVDNATVTLNTPVEGAIPITWVQDMNMGTYTLSQYSSTAPFTYVPNAVYSVAVGTPYGTADASLTSPGVINFAADGSSVTATYPGNYDQAQVMRSYPSPVTTFVSTTGVNVGSPYTYPSSAYDAPSFPATFNTTYDAGMTVTTFTGTGGASGGFVGTQSLTDTFTR